MIPSYWHFPPIKYALRQTEQATNGISVCFHKKQESTDTLPNEIQLLVLSGEGLFVKENQTTRKFIYFGR